MQKLNIAELHIHLMILLARYSLILSCNEEIKVVGAKEESSIKFWNIQRSFTILWMVLADPYLVPLDAGLLLEHCTVDLPQF